jgi:hypothetical protein
MAKALVIHQWLARVGCYAECMCGFVLYDHEIASPSCADRAAKIDEHDKLIAA